MPKNIHWEEWQGPEPDAFLAMNQFAEIFITEGHPETLGELRDSLVSELRMSGAAETARDAQFAADGAMMVVGWHGFVDEDRIPAFCTADGVTEDGDTVERAIPCVYAVIGLEYLS